jgi:hypothetical protein
MRVSVSGLPNSVIALLVDIGPSHPTFAGVENALTPEDCKIQHRLAVRAALHALIDARKKTESPRVACHHQEYCRRDKDDESG